MADQSITVNGGEVAALSTTGGEFWTQSSGPAVTLSKEYQQQTFAAPYSRTQQTFGFTSQGSTETLTPQGTNPSFDVDNSGWALWQSTVTRDTSVYQSSPASGLMNVAAGTYGDATYYFWLTGTPGQPITMRLYLRADAVSTIFSTGVWYRDSAWAIQGKVTKAVTIPVANSWFAHDITFTPMTSDCEIQVTCSNNANATPANIWIDNISSVVTTTGAAATGTVTVSPYRTWRRDSSGWLPIVGKKRPVGAVSSTSTSVTASTVQSQIDAASSGTTVDITGKKVTGGRITLKNGVTLKGGLIDGSGVTGFGPDWGALVTVVTGSKIDGTTVTNSAGMGIGMEWIDDGVVGPSNVSITNCVITNCIGPGIFVKGGDSITVTGNRLDTVCSTNGANEGISFDNVDNSTISNNVVRRCKKESIDVKNGSTNVTIQGNDVALGDRVGIYADAYSFVESTIYILDNKIHDFSNAWGICLAAENGGTLSGVTIKNNIVERCQRGIGAHMSTANMTNITMEANKFQGSMSAVFWNAPIFGTFTNNQIDGSIATSSLYTSGVTETGTISGAWTARTVAK